MSSGNMAIAGAAAYLNGIAEAGSMSGTITTTYALMIGCMSESGVPRPGAFFYGEIQALSIYSDILTAGEVATVSAAMAAL